MLQKGMSKYDTGITCNFSKITINGACEMAYKITCRQVITAAGDGAAAAMSAFKYVKE